MKLFSSLNLFLFICTLPTVYLLGESFVVAKKVKTPSASKLKEQCCQECASILELTPELLRAVADIHQMAHTNVRCYIDNGTDGFIASKSKEQLAASHEKLQKLHSRMESLIAEIRECHTSLQTPHLKV